MSSSSTIYIGFWSDYSKDGLSRTTLTLSSTSANLLIAFTALFVRIVGGQVWSIIGYMLYQIRVGDRDQVYDGLHHQHRVLLRNTTSPTAFALDILLGSWAWRSRVRHLRRRYIGYFLLALTNTIAFSMAGVFSSRVGNTDSEVLLRSDNCGWLNYNASYWVDTALANAEGKVLLSQVQAYAQSCYSTSDSLTSTCNTLVRSNLSWTTDHITDCPFENGVCLTPYSLFLDTGLIDSALDLGLNAPPEDRVTIRKTNTCAPLNTTNFSNMDLTRAGSPYTSGNSSDQMQLSYGAGNEGLYRFLYYYSQFTAPLPRYYLQTQASMPNSDWSTAFVSESTTDTHRVQLWCLASQEIYMNPVSDPWFNATFFEMDLGVSSYQSSSLLTVLGCVESTQYCHALANRSTECTQSGDYETPTSTDFDLAGFNANQKVTLQKLQTAYHPLDAPALDLGGNALLAEKYEWDGSPFSIQLPENQWELELQNWQAITLAYLQLSLVNNVTGPLTAESRSFVEKYNAAENAAQCMNQKVRSSQVTSFSVLGLGIVFGVGLFLILLNFSLPSLVKYRRIRRGSEAGMDKQRAWTADSLLQLQRTVYEQERLGTWTGADGRVPVTEKDEVFRAPEQRIATPLEPCPEYAKVFDDEESKANSFGKLEDDGMAPSVSWDSPDVELLRPVLYKDSFTQM